jgi:SAM-dependent methyltransferase
MAGAPGSFSELKKNLRSMWMAGDFRQIARMNEQECAKWVNQLGLTQGMKVLDVACGTGNQSVPAAKAGATVTGVDIAPNLLEHARKRAADEGLQVEFLEGDAEQLPHNDASFDAVISMFGAMFAPRPEVVASELLRVCRPGGFVAMANWTPGGFVGKMFALTAKHAPPPPGMLPPVLWGDEETAKKRLGGRGPVSTKKHPMLFDMPFGPADVVEHFRKYFGPTQATFARLDPPAQEALRKDLVRLWEEHNEGDAHHLVVKGEYLEVRASVA